MSGVEMNRILFPLSLLLVLNSWCIVHAQDNWHLVKSSDVVIEATLPGPATKKLDKTRSLAGTITTRIMEFHTDKVEFSVSSTKLPRFVSRIADDERLYKNAKDGVLNRFFGKQKSLSLIHI